MGQRCCKISATGHAEGRTDLDSTGKRSVIEMPKTPKFSKKMVSRRIRYTYSNEGGWVEGRGGKVSS